MCIIYYAGAYLHYDTRHVPICGVDCEKSHSDHYACLNLQMITQVCQNTSSPLVVSIFYPARQ